MAKVLEQGPVLILTFSAQQLMIVRNAKGEVVEGGEVSPPNPLSKNTLVYTYSAQRSHGGGEGEGPCPGAVQETAEHVNPPLSVSLPSLSLSHPSPGQH